MDIESYLWMHKLTQEEFAQQIGISRSQLYLYLLRKVSPSLETAIKIHKETNGAIKYEDMVKGKGEIITTRQKILENKGDTL